ncbi:hypothetical protein MNEG_4638 [Monoraphidium neglectum]|uniref:Uncharacterized protein n=1 Tax=Monoraphidium neglectum TaxID=145388 RepID=A0A0D2MSD4_9CHLO|nr:hypothetical protein MNEG_4638 [Monoraphidium neglectum]KIZ03322.1 hypothetical protein MNEG_4638 [Monoraphidium neglectum]|eukprot:XP_013902341.1 hypothetical protein MNEG_4638 [Monoraphidium neglectum]
MRIFAENGVRRTMSKNLPGTIKTGVTNKTTAPATTNAALFPAMRETDLGVAAARNDLKGWALTLDKVVHDADEDAARTLNAKAEQFRTWFLTVNAALPAAERAELARLTAASSALAGVAAAGGDAAAQIAAIMKLRAALPPRGPHLPARPRHKKDQNLIIASRAHWRSEAQVLGLLAAGLATMQESGLEDLLVRANNTDPCGKGRISAVMRDAAQQHRRMARRMARLAANGRAALASGVIQRAAGVESACAATDKVIAQLDAVGLSAAASLAPRALAAPPQGSAARGSMAACCLMLCAAVAVAGLPAARDQPAARKLLRSFKLRDIDISGDADSNEDGSGRDGRDQDDGPDAGSPFVLVPRRPTPDGTLDGGMGAEAEPEGQQASGRGRRAADASAPMPRARRVFGWAKAALSRGFAAMF